jgi:hypothetical protein
MGYVDGLVDHEVKNFAGLRVVVSEHTADGVVSLGTEGRVVTLDLDGSIVISNN